MKKYYGITTFIWLAFSVGLLVVGIWKTYAEGFHNSWFYFIAFVFASLLCLRRWKTWKNVQKEI